jgi:hypothetical protein
MGLAILTSVLFSALGTDGSGSAALLVRQAGAASASLVTGFSMVFACMAGALALSAAAALQLPPGAPPAH